MLRHLEKLQPWQYVLVIAISVIFIFSLLIGIANASTIVGGYIGFKNAVLPVSPTGTLSVSYSYKNTYFSENAYGQLMVSYDDWNTVKCYDLHGPAGYNGTISGTDFINVSLYSSIDQVEFLIATSTSGLDADGCLTISNKVDVFSYANDLQYPDEKLTFSSTTQSSSNVTVDLTNLETIQIVGLGIFIMLFIIFLFVEIFMAHTHF